MITIGGVLASVVSLPRAGRGTFHAPQRLQSWPGIVHGGALLAALDAAAARAGFAGAPRVLEGRLTSSVPLETELALDARKRDGAMTLAVLQDGQTLTSATVAPRRDDGPAPAPAWRGGTAGWSLPLSEDCLACGARNPLGLQVGLSFDDEGVWARLVPRAPWSTEAGALHPAVAPVLLDEIAWWLGALMMQEGGLTNRIALTLLDGALPAGTAVIGAGRFARVEPIDRRRTFWRTASALLTETGTPLATASIVFRGGPEYSARQMDYFRARTAPDLFRRMFPRHAR
ncbi:MAG: hypothetical protein HYV93_21420 [Candidatus Rokubacteria bacterium]|nr:hypothetical protein [Candidatus Rokubacteria bacterium]